MLRSFGLISLSIVGLAFLSKPADAQLRARTRRVNRAVFPNPETSSNVREVVSDSVESSVPVEADCDGTTGLTGRGKFTFRAEGRLTVDNGSYVSFARENPSMIKTDNGSAFRSEAFAKLLEEHEVLALRSPPYTPRYNGAVETGIGTLKTHVHYAAARQDRPGEWTCDDVEEARLRGNACSRPRGGHGGTPDQLWSDRIRIGEE